MPKPAPDLSPLKSWLVLGLFRLQAGQHTWVIFPKDSALQCSLMLLQAGILLCHLKSKVKFFPPFFFCPRTPSFVESTLSDNLIKTENIGNASITGKHWHWKQRRGERSGWREEKEKVEFFSSADLCSAPSRALCWVNEAAGTQAEVAPAGEISRAKACPVRGPGSSGGQWHKQA